MSVEVRSKTRSKPNTVHYAAETGDLNMLEHFIREGMASVRPAARRPNVGSSLCIVSERCVDVLWYSTDGSKLMLLVTGEPRERDPASPRGRAGHDAPARRV